MCFVILTSSKGTFPKDGARTIRSSGLQAAEGPSRTQDERVPPAGVLPSQTAGWLWAVAHGAAPSPREGQGLGSQLIKPWAAATDRHNLFFHVNFYLIRCVQNLFQLLSISNNSIFNNEIF